MYSENQDYKLLSPTMGTIHGSSERLKPLDQRNSTSVTPFKGLHESSNNKSLNLGDNEGDQSQVDSCPSDCESAISRPENEQKFRSFDNGLISISDGEMIYDTIQKKLRSSLSSCGLDHIQVEGIHRIDYSVIMRRAKLHCFCIYSRAMEMNRGGVANIKYAWYGACKDEINQILLHGFGLPDNTQTHGLGVYLSPVDHPIESLRSLTADDDGINHMLLCRVIMGKVEVVYPGTEQYNPSSEEFDSGVDDLASPQKYIIWSSRMNTHILPEFLVSFRASSSSKGHQMSSQPQRKPKSDWMPFGTLVAMLSKYLPRDAVELVAKHHSDYRRKKITRHEMIQRARCIAGDKLLMEIIKRYSGK